MAKNSLFGDNTLFSGFNLGQNNKDFFSSSNNPLFSDFSSQDKKPEKTNKPEQPNSIFNNIGLFTQDIKKNEQNNFGGGTNLFGGSMFQKKIEIDNNKNEEDNIDDPSLYSPHMKNIKLGFEKQGEKSNISNEKNNKFIFSSVNDLSSIHKISKSNENYNNYNNNYNKKQIENKEEIEEEEEIEEKKEEPKKEDFEKELVSEELNKPDELKSVDNKEYLNLINKKINNYKRQLDSSLYKIDENKNELMQQEKKFNNIKDLLNISQNVINYIGDSIDNNERELENIIENQEKIIQDLDNIEENLNKKIKSSQNKNEILKENKDKNNDIEKMFNSIGNKIENCYKMMIDDSKNLKINNNPKTLNELLDRIYWKIKQDIQGKEAKVINEIYYREKNFINGK